MGLCVGSWTCFKAFLDQVVFLSVHAAAGHQSISFPGIGALGPAWPQISAPIRSLGSGLANDRVPLIYNLTDESNFLFR